MSKVKYVFCIAAIGSTVFLYQNCADQSFTVIQSSVDYSLSMSPSCIGDNNLIVVSIDQDIEGDISFKCKDSNTEFVNCNNYDLDGGVVKASDGNLVFSQLDNDSYSLTVQLLITSNNGDITRDTFEVNFERCQPTPTTTETTATTETTTTATTTTTECTTCLSRITDSACQVCSNANSCTETPIAKTISCGSEGMSAYPLSTEPTCPTGNRILCNKTCYRGGSATCTADPSTCTTCPNGECGQPQTGQTCSSRITDSACQVCSNPNSCSESPAAKAITCGSEGMSAYPLSTEPTCPTGNRILCNKTCYRGGSATCTADPSTCTTCPNGECGQPQTGQTCDQRRNNNACKVCSNPNSCTETPRDKRCSSGQVCENGVCITLAECNSDSDCSGSCNRCNNGSCTNQQVSCRANPATCTTCPNGECGQPQRGQTCDQRRNNNACKVCSNPNSCTETPRDKRCSSGQVCENGVCITPAECNSDSDCSGSCNRCNNGSCTNQQVSCRANPATCTTCPNGECGQPQTGQTCSSQITDSACQVCSNPNSCTETPAAKAITCGSEGMSAYPLSTEPTCSTGSRTLCNKTCYRGGSATCTADLSTCTTCPDGECGRPQTGQTCLSQITDSTCQVCSNPNSCSESPVAKTITCGSGDMASYPLSTRPACPTGELTLCGTTCYSGGPVTCTVNSATCTTCPNGECGQPQRGQTCLSQITDSACQVCSNPNSCTESPSNRTITCGSGDMAAYPLSTVPNCPTGQSTLCNKTCYSGTATTCTPNSSTCTTCPSGECGPPKVRRTCGDRANGCQVCSNPNSCTESPRRIRCGEGVMRDHPNTVKPRCLDDTRVGAFKQACGIICYQEPMQSNC